MPELAEVEFCRRQWQQELPFHIEKVITSDSSRVYRNCSPTKVQERLLGKTLVESFRHGKQLFFKTNDHLWLNVHLGMTGFLCSKKQAENWKKRDALILIAPSGLILHFDDFRMFGKVDLFEEKPTFQTPDPCEEQYNRNHLQNLVKRFPKKQLKAFILDQNCCPGFGNWMADEVMWRMGRLPNTKVSNCDIDSFFQKLKFVAEKSIYYIADGNGAPFSTYKKKPKNHWGAPPEDWLFQSRWKKDLECPSCPALLSRETFAGRTTCFCAQCQN